MNFTTYENCTQYFMKLFLMYWKDLGKYVTIEDTLNHQENMQEGCVNNTQQIWCIISPTLSIL